MDFRNSAHTADLVPQRDCGTCALCCKVYTVAAVPKQEGIWCQHCIVGQSCKIYAERPTDCRDFYCLWRSDPTLPEAWKPERCKFVITLAPSTGYTCVQVDPGFPQAWRREPYFTGLTRWSEKLLARRLHLIVFVRNQATLIMPSEAVPIGTMSSEDGFVVRERLTAQGKRYEVERVPGRQAPAA